MRWLEEYCSRLESGMYRPDELVSISAMPSFGEDTSEAVTRGVRCTASVLQVNMGPDVGQDGKIWFTYQIEFQLLSLSQQREQCRTCINSVQLDTRYWHITDGDGSIDEVRGEAVIGKKPILEAGGPSFKYNSLTSIRRSGGSMHGSFSFVEGTLAAPTGGKFDVVCAPFRLVDHSSDDRFIF